MQILLNCFGYRLRHIYCTARGKRPLMLSAKLRLPCSVSGKWLTEFRKFSTIQPMRTRIGYLFGCLLLSFLLGCQQVGAKDSVSGEETAVFPPTITSTSPTATPIAIAAAPQATAYPAPELPTAYPSQPTFQVQIQPAATPLPASAVPVYGYRILNEYPHDSAAFTQGLIYIGDDILLEGTGQRGASSLRRVVLPTGEVVQQHDLAQEFFGEGIALWQDKIIQLTWQSQTGFVYDATSFAELARFRYPTEGWGITHDGTKLIMSDGSDTLYFWNPETLAETGRVAVFDDNGPVVRLNELEYINGEVWANIWQTDRIARIDPATGAVVGWVDLTGLLSAADRQQRVDVLNGIAWDEKNGRLFVTGKWWPKLFEIELVEKR